MNILIVDDVETNRKLLRAQLEAGGYDVVEARDGVEALDAVARYPVAAVISDILMPQMDGYRLCQELRKDERFRNLPMIFYTSTYTAKDDEKLAYQFGVDKFLTKPVSANVLLASLRQVIGNRESRGLPDKPQPDELRVLREYSEVLVRKLEHKNELLQQVNRDLERRVIERTRDLEAANAELESFSYSVSHDLRAPLRAIDGFSRVLEEEYGSRLDAEGKRLLDVIRTDTRKMGQLIDDLLAFSRMGRTEMMKERLDMDKLVRGIFEEIVSANPGRRIALRMAGLPPVHGDRAMMRQVVTNLLSNAVKFTGTRDQAAIEVGGALEGGNCTYSVKDNGVGFETQYANKLFGVFQRLHSAEEFEGTGVGLAIVQRVLHRHGGRAWAESELGKGAVFYFSLPVGGNDEGSERG